MELFGIKDFDSILVLGILIFFALIETISGHLKNSKRKGNDWIQEAGSFFLLSGFIKPATILTVIFLGNTLFANTTHFLSSWSILLSLPFYLLIDDLLQYWYHRSAHEYTFLWKLHRPHHQAEEMGYFVSYRNAVLYYLLMPNIWWMGICTFLGGGLAVAIGLILKQIVIISSHSTVKWDAGMYQHNFFKPFVYLLERVIITPAFHHGHHGKSQVDGISEPNGNYGNMFSIWDQLFGTAKFAHKFPKEYGLPINPKENWQAPMLYPLVHAKENNSELSKGFKHEVTSSNDAIIIELEKGKNYLWCACGKSKCQPFCDGSHHGSKFKPVLFEAKRNGKVKLCNCKITKNPPFCDNSHEALK